MTLQSALEVSVCPHPSDDLARSIMRLSFGVCLVKIFRAKSSYNCRCSGSKHSKDSSLIKACEHVPNARLAVAQMARSE